MKVEFIEPVILSKEDIDALQRDMLLSMPHLSPYDK